MATAIATVGAAVIGSRASSKATRAATQGQERAQDLLAASRDRARQDVLRLFPQAQEAQTRGFTQAQDFLSGQVIPRQAEAFQTGNVQAQETLLQGLPQVQAALLGGNVDLSGLQPQQTAIPQFNVPLETTPTATLNPNLMAGPLANIGKIDFSSLLTGGGFGGGNPQLFDFQRSFR